MSVVLTFVLAAETRVRSTYLVAVEQFTRFFNHSCQGANLEVRSAARARGSTGGTAAYGDPSALERLQ